MVTHAEKPCYRFVTTTKKTKNAAIEDGFKEALSLSTVIGCPVGNTKLSVERFNVQMGHLQLSDTHRSAQPLTPRRWRCQIPKMLCRNTSSGSLGFWCTKCSLPQMLAHTCVCTGHLKQPWTKKKKKKEKSSQAPKSSAHFPQHSLYPASWSKFVYVCGVTSQVTSKTPTQHTLWYII